MELTILMPCLNEAETLETCIRKAQTFLRTHNIDGEVLIADNGSTDGSREIAERCGARTAPVAERGYGAALIGGCDAALGKYVIMGDADDSYDFLNLMPFLERLRAGDELVMGNRFKGGIEKGAMPPLHRYLGNPVLSTIGRVFFPSKIKDFHCGLRAYNTESIRKLGLRTTGMEYASEMVVQATLQKLKISEVPTTLRPDGRSRPPHLRSWRDGWRHLKFLLMYSPKWLFFAPGLLFVIIGVITTVTLAISPLKIGNFRFGGNTMVYTVLLIIIGTSILSFGIIAKIYAHECGYIPQKSESLFVKLTADRGSLIGALLCMLGVIATVIALLIGKVGAFGAFETERVLRLTLPTLAVFVVGIQLISTAFLADIIRIRKKENRQ
jgi:glycosyltransferase involved in cell wall biosynthesis